MASAKMGNLVSRLVGNSSCLRRVDVRRTVIAFSPMVYQDRFLDLLS